MFGGFVDGEACECYLTKKRASGMPARYFILARSAV